jgi:hypothetical protein
VTPRLAWAPDLVENAVLAAEPSMTRDERRLFRRERDNLYGIGDVDRREQEFGRLHRRWFTTLGLHEAAERSITESLDGMGIAEGRVIRAVSSRDEGADLVDSVVPGATSLSAVLVVRLRPEALLRADAVRALLSHELMHVRDMLDPAFGYERALPRDTGPLTETMLRDRYRVVWDATIDGRLTRAGRPGRSCRSERRQEFETTFAMLGTAAGEAFEAWFNHERPTHQDLLAFARAPSAMP